MEKNGEGDVIPLKTHFLRTILKLSHEQRRSAAKGGRAALEQSSYHNGSAIMAPQFSQDGIVLTRDPSTGIFLLHLNRLSSKNVFDPTFVGAVSSAIKHVEKASHPKALVITGLEYDDSSGDAAGATVNNNNKSKKKPPHKFFSNGLSLEYMLTNPEGTAPMIESVWRLLGRILILDCRTVAAINGHAFGAGLFLALACDYRLMRTERGFVNFPELNLGMRLAKGFAEISKAKLTTATLREGVLTGKRYGSGDAVQAGIVDEECAVEELLERAVAMAEAGLPDNLGAASFDAQSFSQMKVELYTDAYRALALGSVDAKPESRL